MAEDAKALVGRMVDALNDHVIDGQEAYWSEDMVWYGPAGIGTKRGLKDFQENHQRPFLHAFPDKSAFDEIRFGEGEWVAATGYQTATHLGEYLGIPASGKPVKIRYMDIWRAENDKLVENWVLIDLLDFLEQLGYNTKNVLKFVGSKPPEFFDQQAEER
jgi:predicted ester cyclase